MVVTALKAVILDASSGIGDHVASTVAATP